MTELFDPAPFTDPLRVPKMGSLEVSQEDFDAVWSAWVADRTKATKMQPRRRNRIIWALSYYPVEVCIAAINGVKSSPWHMGSNPHGRRYDDIKLILRDAKHIEWFSTLATAEFPVSEPERFPETAPDEFPTGGAPDWAQAETKAVIGALGLMSTGVSGTLAQATVIREGVASVALDQPEVSLDAETFEVGLPRLADGWEAEVDRIVAEHLAVIAVGEPGPTDEVAEDEIVIGVNPRSPRHQLAQAADGAW